MHIESRRLNSSITGSHPHRRQALNTLLRLHFPQHGRHNLPYKACGLLAGPWEARQARFAQQSHKNPAPDHVTHPTHGSAIIAITIIAQSTFSPATTMSQPPLPNGLQPSDFYSPGSYTPFESVGFLMRKVLSSILQQADAQLAAPWRPRCRRCCPA
jgi:hypothetical protein